MLTSSMHPETIFALRGGRFSLCRLSLGWPLRLPGSWPYRGLTACLGWRWRRRFFSWWRCSCHLFASVLFSAEPVAGDLDCVRVGSEMFAGVDRSGLGIPTDRHNTYLGG